MGQITAYKARDGQVFEDEREYLRHEGYLDLADEMQDDEAYFYGCLQLHNGHALLAFLQRHESAIMRALGYAL